MLQGKLKLSTYGELAKSEIRGQGPFLACLRTFPWGLLNVLCSVFGQQLLSPVTHRGQL